MLAEQQYRVIVRAVPAPKKHIGHCLPPQVWGVRQLLIIVGWVGMNMNDARMTIVVLQFANKKFEYCPYCYIRMNSY